MNDELDSIPDDSEELFEWSATGDSCAVCEGLDGMTFTSPPVAVHPKCDCTVVPGRGRRNPTDCTNGYEVTSMSSRWEGSPVQNHLIVEVDFTVTCWDGTTISDQVDLDFGVDPDIDIDTFDDELWLGVSDHAEELIAMHCPACEPFRNV